VLLLLEPLGIINAQIIAMLVLIGTIDFLEMYGLRKKCKLWCRNFLNEDVIEIFSINLMTISMVEFGNSGIKL